MSGPEVLDHILESGIVAVIRGLDPTPIGDAIAAMAAGGVTVAEITLTVPNALELVRATRKRLSEEAIIGAGTILDAETARAAILAGAQFIVTPVLNLDVIRLCKRYNVPVMPGAFTPTEILAAWEAGADIVKVFPADVVGPAFFRAIRGPFPYIRLMPTGGVDLSTAKSFLEAGASCLGVGAQLFDAKRVAAGDFASVTARASEYHAAIASFRGG